jgi:hypothetical protein
MSKRNLSMGTASGKLGDIVYYRRRGQQAMRTYRSTIANPQTDLQMDTRVVFRNPQTYYMMMKQTDLDLLGLKSKYGNNYSQFMRVGMRKQVAISKNAAANGYSLPFPIGETILTPSQTCFPYVEETKPSTLYQTRMITGLRLRNSTTPTTIADLASSLMVYNGWLRNGDRIAIWAAAQTEQINAYADYGEDNSTLHLFFDDFELSSDDTTSLANVIPNWKVGYKTQQSSIYNLTFWCQALDTWGKTTANQVAIVLTMVVYRPIRNKKKQILFRYSESNDAQKEWAAEFDQPQDWAAIRDSYRVVR